MTTVEGLHLGPQVRRNGKLVALRAPLVDEIPFALGAEPRLSMSLPWGDLVTAHHSTRIPNITVYGQAPRAVIRGSKLMRVAAPLLRRPAVQSFLKNQADKRAKGPTDEQRRTEHMWIWGRVRNPNGQRVEGHLRTPEAYELTVLAALRCVERVLAGETSPGATTPALAFGAELVTELPGVQSFQIVR